MNLADIIENSRNLEPDQKQIYLESVFNAKGYKEYESVSMSSYQLKALKVLFTGKEDLYTRSLKALELESLNFEAFYVFYCLSDDEMLFEKFAFYYNQGKDYFDLDSYEKDVYVEILHYYIDFLFYIENYSSGLKALRLLDKLLHKTDQEILIRYSYAFSKLERSEEFYRLYCQNDFENLYCYILLVICLLKNDETQKARQVLFDCFEKIEYADYIDHIYDLDQSDPKQDAIISVIDEIYEHINSCPDFFKWVSLVKADYDFKD